MLYDVLYVVFKGVGSPFNINGHHSTEVFSLLIQLLITFFRVATHFNNNSIKTKQSTSIDKNLKSMMTFPIAVYFLLQNRANHHLSLNRNKSKEHS